MSTNKQALRQLAEGVGREEWQARKEPGIGGEHTVIVKGSLVKRSGWSTHRPVADQVVDKKTAKFIAAANPATALALLDELEAAESRIAELEAREVKLPQRQEPTSSGHYGEGYLVPSNAGSALDYEETVETIRAAGISVKGE